MNQYVAVICCIAFFTVLEQHGVSQEQKESFTLDKGNELIRTPLGKYNG